MRTQRVGKSSSGSAQAGPQLLPMTDDLLLELANSFQNAQLKEGVYDASGNRPLFVTARYPDDRVLSMSWRAGGYWDVPQQVYLTVRDSKNPNVVYQRLVPITFLQGDPFKAIYEAVWGQGRRARMANVAAQVAAQAVGLGGNAAQGAATQNAGAPNAAGGNAAGTQAASSNQAPAGQASAGQVPAAGAGSRGMMLPFGQALEGLMPIFERYLGRRMEVQDYVNFNRFYTDYQGAFDPSNPQEFYLEFLRRYYWGEGTGAGGRSSVQQSGQSQGILGSLLGHLSANPKELTELLTLILLMQSMKRS